MEKKKKESWRVARHESGHWVVATTLGFEARYIGKTAQKAGADISLVRPISDPESMTTYVEDRIKVLYAGCAAQELKPDGIENLQKAVDFFDTNTAADRDKAKTTELLALLGNMHPDGASPETLKPISIRLWQETADLVVENRKAIKVLTDAVFALREGHRLERATILKFTEIKDLVERRNRG